MTLPSNIQVLGAGGHAKVVIATVRAAGGEVAAVFDDDPARTGATLLGAPIRGAIGDALNDAPAIVAIGDNSARARVAKERSMSWVTVVHPASVVHETAELGPGVVVFAGAVVQPECRVGAHTIVNSGASIDHDCDIGAFSHIAPGVALSGGVSVGEGTLLGVGAAAAPGVTIGDWAVVGAGAVCVADIASRTVAIGVPAKPRSPTGRGMP